MRRVASLLKTPTHSPSGCWKLSGSWRRRLCRRTGTAAGAISSGPAGPPFSPRLGPTTLARSDLKQTTPPARDQPAGGIFWTHLKNTIIMTATATGIKNSKPRGSRFLAQHLAKLNSCGITEKAASANGLYSESDPHKIKEILGDWISVKTAAEMGPALVIPFHGGDGRYLKYTDKDGKTQLYFRIRPD